jgi:hypothetical protein
MKTRRQPVTLVIVPRPEIAEDIANLPTRELQREALQMIAEIRKHPFRSQPLDDRANTGDLSDCRKKFFDNARYRVIYRLLPDEQNPTTADIIVVGSRAFLEVYDEAVKRLGR